MLNLINAQKGFSLNRRSMLRFGAGMALYSTASHSGPKSDASAENETGFSEPKDDLQTHIKLIGTLEKEDVYVALDGTLWAIAPNREPAPICGFHGLARSMWSPQKDGSYSQRSFDIGYFGDLESGEPLDSVKNPITNEEVSPFHFRYGGNQVIHTEETLRSGLQSRWQTTGRKLWYTEQRGGTFPTPFPSSDWPRENSGDEFLFGSETSYLVSEKELNDRTVRRADYTLFWTAFLSWEPWLLMDGAPGFVMWRGVASKLGSISEVSPTLKAYIETNQANYFAPNRPWEGRASTYESYKKQRGAASPRD